MNLFDQLVNEALKNQPIFAPMRIVVEKELLHHDILRELSHAGLLAGLTFIGGTCLRACYGSNRLSEDLDFTGGAGFSRDSLATMAHTLVNTLGQKYGLHVDVSLPTRETGNVDTWKLKIQTRPGRRDQPAQRINIDICAIPSYQVRPMMLLNPYGVEMGTSGLIVQVESREEIFADKLLAFALRPNRIKYRDLWDITWLHQHSVKLPIDLIPNKLQDHRCDSVHFLSVLDIRRRSLKNDAGVLSGFKHEMQRFLPSEQVQRVCDQPMFWDFLINLVDDLCASIQDSSR